MRAVLLRRMMVLAVCAVGVSALYVVPGLTAPQRVGAPAPGGEVPLVPVTRSPLPSVAPVAARASHTEQPVSVEPEPGPSKSTPSQDPSAPAAAVADPTSAPAAAAEPPADPLPTRTRPAPRASSTPFDTTPDADTTPPDPVTELAVRDSDPDQLRIAWAPSSDDLGAVTYRVWLNGYEVASTTDTEATLDWFNDDNAQQVLVVRAVDQAGNQSGSPTAMLLKRPEPAATPTPEAGTSPPTDPVASPSPTASRTR